METTRQPHVNWRQPLAPLGVLTIVGMVGCAFGALIMLLLVGELIVPILIVALVLLVFAGIVALGARWLPLLGALDALGTMIGGLVSRQYLPYHLTHPEQLGFFMAALLMYAFGIVAVCAGISATLQNYRAGEGARRAPRWLPIPISVLIGFLLGALFAAGLVQGTTNATPATGANGTTVHMGVSTFSPAVITISKGASLTLIDDGSFPHVLDNGQWLNGSPHQASETGALTVNNVQVNGNTVTLGPFTVAGTYHVFCTIHLNMNLTVIVQ